MLRRAAAEGVRAGLDAGSQTYPLAARVLRWLAGGLVFAATGVGTGYMVAHPEQPEPRPVPPTERQPECTDALEQHLLHLARTGDDLARQLAADGLSQYAALVSAMTDVDQLPDDLKLCLLLARREETHP